VSSLRPASRSWSGGARNSCGKRIRPRYVPKLSRVECIVNYCCDCGCLLGMLFSSSSILCKKKRGGGFQKNPCYGLRD
jgi:hypothetical protein